MQLVAQQLLATFQGAQVSVEKVTTVPAAERKEGGHTLGGGEAGHGMTVSNCERLRQAEACTLCQAREAPVRSEPGRALGQDLPPNTSGPPF